MIPFLVLLYLVKIMFNALPLQVEEELYGRH